MTQLSLFSEADLKSPNCSAIRSIISKISPAQSINVLKREIAKAYPDLTWHLKQTGEEWYSVVASVVAANGVLVAPNAKEWFAEQAEAIGADRLISRIKAENLQLARNEGGNVYAMGVDPNEPLNFYQICIHPQLTAICSLGDIEASTLPYAPDGYPFDWGRAQRSAPAYACSEAINSLQWLERCKISESQRREIEYAHMGEMTLTESFSDGRPDEVTSFFETHPYMVGWDKRPGREARWFADWNASSASIHSMGQHWYLETSDYKNDEYHHVGFIPQGINWPKKKLVRSAHLSPLQLIEKLERFDRLVKCPFGWYFYMLHGNRLTNNEGRAIAAAVRAGQLHLKPCDEAVLLAWDNDPYGF